MTQQGQATDRAYAEAWAEGYDEGRREIPALAAALRDMTEYVHATWGRLPEAEYHVGCARAALRACGEEV